MTKRELIDELKKLIKMQHMQHCPSTLVEWNASVIDEGVRVIEAEELIKNLQEDKRYDEGYQFEFSMGQFIKKCKNCGSIFSSVMFEFCPRCKTNNYQFERKNP